MKQILIQRAGKPEVLTMQETPAHVPSNGQVRIKVEVCGINFADILGRMGIYPDAPPIPYVPGYEVAGVVDMVGQGVTGLEIGDPVFALTQFGGYSNSVCVPYKQVFKRPTWMSAQDAAALPVNYLTAYIMLVVMGALHGTDKVLIHGAAGGVGLAALDICKIMGAETFGTASPSKHPFLQERGLTHAIDYRNLDYARVVQDITDGRGVNLILDPLGGVNWMKNYNLLRPTGRVVYFGASSVATGKRRSLLATAKLLFSIPRFSPLQLMNDNRAVMGVNIGHLWGEAESLGRWMEQIVAWYDDALFRPQIDKVFSFDEATEAHHYIQDRKNIGKVLLRA